MKTEIFIVLLCCNGMAVAEQVKEQEPSSPSEIDEIVVTETKKKRDFSEPSLEAKKLFSVPGAEGDPLHAIFSMPGVLFASDDGAEPAVRGSAPEDNDFLVDSMPVGNVYHPFGFSIFNNNVIADFTLLPAAYPAEYGNATGAVFDVTLREPRHQEMAYTFDYSFLRTGIMVEGEIAKDHAFYFSYRRSLLDVYFDAGDLNDEADEEDEGIKVEEIPRMSDYQGKYTWDIGTSNMLSFTVVGSNDDFSAKIEKDSAEAQVDPDVAGRLVFDSSFNSQAIAWQSILNSDSEIKTTLGRLYSAEELSLGTGQFLNFIEETLLFKTKYSLALNDRHDLRVGGELGQTKINYKFEVKIIPCSDFQPDCFPNVSDRIADTFSIDAKSRAVFIEDEWQPLEDVSLTVGVNASNDDYIKERLTEPRASVKWKVEEQWTLKFAAGEYHRQPDGEKMIRKIGNPNIRSFKARHYTVGLAKDDGEEWSWNLDLYFKELYDLPLALSEDQLDAHLKYTNDAKGEAYGTELLIEKKLSNKWSGWLAISLARSERTDLRANKTSKFTGDTPVVVNSVFQYQLNEHWNIGGRYTWRTGAAYTPIIGLVQNPDYPDLFRPTYAELNSKRLPSYQRFDARAERKIEVWGKKASLTFEVINLFNHENVEGYSYDPQPSDTPTSFKLEKDEGLPFFVSVGFRLFF